MDNFFKMGRDMDSFLGQNLNEQIADRRTDNLKSI